MSIISNKIKGLTIEIGGETTGLTKALGEVNKHSRDLKSELRDVERLLKLDPSNTELLSQKQKILAESIENTSNKLNTLKEAEKQAQEQFKQGKIAEDQYRAIQREVIKTEEELKKMEKTLKQMDWKNIADGLDKFGDKSTEVGKTLTTRITAPILAAGAAAFKFGSDIEDAFGATDQIFKDSAEEVKKWADELESYYGIAESEALEYANTMGAMLQNIGGLTEEEAAKQSATLIELAGDLTAMFGGTTESAVQALTGALKGNNSMLDNYGMGVNEATIKTKALEMGLIAEGEQLDLAGKQAATLALIMEQTADAQGQAGREAEGASGSMRALVTELKNLATDIGEVLLPIITPFIAKLKEIVAGFGELSPKAQKTIVVIAGIAAAIGPLLIILGKMATGLSSIITLIGGAGGVSAVIAALTGPIGIAIVAITAIIAIIVSLYKTNEEFRDNVKAIWEQIKEIFKVAMEFIQKIITDIYNAILKFWTENGDKIKSFTKALWDSISNLINAALKIISGVLDVFIGLFTGDWSKMGEGIKKIWFGMWDGIKTIVSGAWNLISGAFSALKNSIAGWFDGIISNAFNWGKNLIGGFVDGIKSMASAVSNAVSNVVGNVKDFLGFNSPAKKGEGRHIVDWGYNMIDGFIDGMKKAMPALEGTLNAAIPGMAGTTNNANFSSSFVVNAVIREEQDINKVAQEFYRLQQQNSRGRGIR